jgi:alkaline phosphatase D
MRNHLFYHVLHGALERVSNSGCILALVLGLLSGSMAWADRYQLDLADGDRVWVAPEFWANRLHDWQVSDGRIECIASTPRLRHRTLTLLTHDIPAAKPGLLEIQLKMGLINADRQTVSPDAAAGVIIGVEAEVDYRSRALIHGATGPGAGYFVGLTAEGRLIAYDLARYLKLVATSAFNDRPSATIAEIFALDSQRAQPSQAAAPAEALGELDDVTLKLALREFVDQQAVFDVHLTQGQRTLQTALRIPQDRIAGGIALGAHPGSAAGKATTGQFWFRDFQLSGDLVNGYPERALGPILSTMYTISDKTLKLTAQMFPISDTAPRQVGLQHKASDGTWVTIDTREIVVPGWTVPFRVDAWDDSQAAHLRVIYPVENPTAEYHCWTTANPVNKEEVVFAGFTGNHMVGRGFERDGYDFATNIWFPHQEVVDAVAFHQPDVLFFSGDQVYEGGSPTFADANPENIKLDYLYKWYLWCWSYHELTRRIPTICIPDDHDVYQGNLWGQGGRKSPDRDHDGGYVHPADFVQMVERTQTSHLPDPYWTQPLEQGITPYYTDFTWGEIGIAVLEDRKFKSGCNRPDMPPSGSGRPDHFNDPDFDVAKLDLPGLKLLGDEQLAFLDCFVQDWRDQQMKIAVSQTIFANMGHEPALLHDGMPGYGIVRMNKPQRTITIECWPRFADPAKADAQQYLGWPKTISQFDNYARKPIGYLADLQIRGAVNPVVSVRNEQTGELVLAVRIQGQRYRVPAF